DEPVVHPGRAPETMRADIGHYDAVACRSECTSKDADAHPMRMQDDVRLEFLRLADQITQHPGKRPLPEALSPCRLWSRSTVRGAVQAVVARRAARHAESVQSDKSASHGGRHQIEHIDDSELQFRPLFFQCLAHRPADRMVSFPNPRRN